MTARAAALLFCALAAAPAAAATDVPAQAAGVAFPATYPAAGQTLQLNGTGVRVFFAVVKGYASALYVSQPTHDAAALLGEPDPKVLFTHFLHNASVAQLRREFSNIHDHYCARNACTPVNEASYQSMLAHLAPVARGDTEAYIVTGAGLQVMHDDKPAFTIDNPAYGHIFLAALLGATSPTPGYRAGLLGKSG